MARDSQSGGSASTRDDPSKLDQLHYCLRMGCDAQLSSVEGDYETLVIRYECQSGHKGSKCLTELVEN